jgi:polysaccharide export outer membrane protein
MSAYAITPNCNKRAWNKALSALRADARKISLAFSNAGRGVCDFGSLVFSPRPLALVCLAVSFGLGSCSLMPEDGPTKGDIIDQAADSASANTGLKMSVVDIDPHVVEALKAAPAPGLASALGTSASDQQQLIKPGDYLVVTIWETGVGGLFSGGVTPTSTGAAQVAVSTVIPEQMVATDGSIAVPYVGRVKISGLTIADAGDRIRARVSGKAASPDVLVSVSHDASDLVTVSGDAIKGTLVTLVPNANRVLDVIAAAGGAQNPDYATEVQVVRNHKTFETSLLNILQNPAENIPLHPKDTLIVSKNAEFFTVLGAVKNNAKMPFDANQLSLAQAIGLAGGLLDEQANPAGVFLFRFEPRDVAAKVCGVCAADAATNLVPVIYRLDMKQASSFFTAQSFEMADHDVLYVADAPNMQLKKFLEMVGEVTSPLLTGAIAARAVEQ